ncbi:MAG: hypothetical protein A2Z38_01595 [Planctomycetes bacterium RBG_19FT_COMBO_48_8]|nr:MAG: hypothetical protein A2Z38_01595 [Planctomycetes bacterium RBG_19FT_COMBO_48_8]
MKKTCGNCELLGETLTKEKAGRCGCKPSKIRGTLSHPDSKKDVFSSAGNKNFYEKFNKKGKKVKGSA